MRPSRLTFFETNRPLADAEDPKLRGMEQFLAVWIHFDSEAALEKFELLGVQFLPAFNKTFGDQVEKRVTGKAARLPGADGGPVIFHLWHIKTADTLLYMIRELADMPEYAQLDGFVAHERQDIFTPMDDADTHGRGLQMAQYKYVLATYRAPVDQLENFAIDVSSTHGTLEHDHPGWFLEDTMIAVTGRVYDILQVWTVPHQTTEEEARKLLDRAAWSKNYLDTCMLLAPTQYDRPQPQPRTPAARTASRTVTAA
jgi:hypothetical protein